MQEQNSKIAATVDSEGNISISITTNNGFISNILWTLATETQKGTTLSLKQKVNDKPNTELNENTEFVLTLS